MRPSARSGLEDHRGNLPMRRCLPLIPIGAEAQPTRFEATCGHTGETSGSWETPCLTDLLRRTWRTACAVRRRHLQASARRAMSAAMHSATHIMTLMTVGHPCACCVCPLISFTLSKLSTRQDTSSSRSRPRKGRCFRVSAKSPLELFHRNMYLRGRVAWLCWTVGPLTTCVQEA